MTLTHARIRLTQGDLPGARQILLELLERDPGNSEALELLAATKRRKQVAARSDDLPPLDPPRSVDPSTLARYFRRKLGRPGPDETHRRIGRLRRLLDRFAPPGE